MAAKKATKQAAVQKAPRQPSGVESNPEILHQIHFSFLPSRVLSSALRLGVFSYIAAGRKNVAAIARAAGSSTRGMRMLLDALIPLGLLTKRNNAYRLTPLASRYLVRNSPDYFGSFFESEGLWESWGQLTKVIRTGKPTYRVEKQELAEQFFPILVKTLHVLHRDRAVVAARALNSPKTRKGLRVLDVACGSSVWGIPFAEADRTARVTAQDFPAILKVTRGYLKRHGVLRQYDFLPGDLNTVKFGVSRYDIAILGNIVHSEGERSSRTLFRKLHRALAPGGRLVIIDMVPNDDRTGPAFPVFFALNMLVNTQHGDTFTLAEYTRWLKAAGFARVSTLEIGLHSPLIVGFKD
jgi:ubiquinone/menaquinone biosynthesis C-methylase UbiE